MTDSGRWTKASEGQGVDPRDTDAEFTDEEKAARRTETRPVVHEQEPTGEQGITSDKPGTDAGPYGKGLSRDDDEGSSSASTAP
jgi:hypothetical protein